jgi:hypothetical protein
MPYQGNEKRQANQVQRVVIAQIGHTKPSREDSRIGFLPFEFVKFCCFPGNFWEFVKHCWRIERLNDRQWAVPADI